MNSSSIRYRYKLYKNRVGFAGKSLKHYVNNNNNVIIEAKLISSPLDNNNKYKKFNDLISEYDLYDNINNANVILVPREDLLQKEKSISKECLLFHILSNKEFENIDNEEKQFLQMNEENNINGIKIYRIQRIRQNVPSGARRFASLFSDVGLNNSDYKYFAISNNNMDKVEEKIRSYSMKSKRLFVLGHCIYKKNDDSIEMCSGEKINSNIIKGKMLFSNDFNSNFSVYIVKESLIE